jgi:hypothetical protein
MKWRANLETEISFVFEIEYDPSVGFYFYVFQNNKCIFDHLEDTFDIAVKVGMERYNIPIDVWHKIAE